MAIQHEESGTPVDKNILPFLDHQDQALRTANTSRMMRSWVIWRSCPAGSQEKKAAFNSCVFTPHRGGQIHADRILSVHPRRLYLHSRE